MAWPACMKDILQHAREQNNTGPLGGPVIIYQYVRTSVHESDYFVNMPGTETCATPHEHFQIASCVHCNRRTARPMAALRLVRARVLCQMRAPYRPITSLPLPPIAGPQNCGPGCCSTPNTPLSAALGHS